VKLASYSKLGQVQRETFKFRAIEKCATQAQVY